MSTQSDGARAAFVVLAGGSGTRVGAGRNKVYLEVAGRPVLAWSLDWAALVAAVGPVVLVIRPGDEDAAAALLAEFPGVETVTGGSTRQRSERAALAHLAPRIAGGSVDVVAIHDGARPLAGAALLAETIAVARRDGGAVPTVPVRGVLPVGPGSELTLPHGELHRVQTPQAFRAPELLAAHTAATAASADDGTDTAAVIERFGTLVVRSVPGADTNLKVTYPADVARAEALLAPALRPGPPRRGAR